MGDSDGIFFVSSAPLISCFFGIFNFSGQDLVRKADGSGILKEFVKNSYHIKYRIDDFILFVFKRSLNTEEKT